MNHPARALALPHSARLTRRRVRLGDVAEHTLGKMLDAEKNRGEPLPYLRNPNIKWFNIDLTDIKTMPFEEREHVRFSLRAGDVLVCEGGEAGRAAIWDGKIPEMKFQKALHRVRVGPELDNRYLVHQLMADYFNGRLAEYYTGATIKHLTGQDLARYEFFLPPLAEQQRIAAILDAADALRQKRRQALRLLDQLSQSIFIEMFGDPATNPKGWPECRLEDCIDPDRPLTYGILMPGPDEPDGVKYVRVVDMRNGAIDLSAVRSTTKEIAAQYRRSTLKAGDLLMSIRGHVGRMAIVPAELAGANITQDTARIAVVNADAEFIQEMIRSVRAQRWMSQRTKGAAVQGINLGDLRNLPLLKPTFDLQRQFAARVKVGRATHLKSAASLARLDTLFASLQHRAFRGEL
jgi:type I restriction enzyme, S subunit